jgi:hypothetical protein
LVPHDLSILLHLIEETPVAVTANGIDHLDNGLVDIGYLNLHYKNKMIANFHVNWLSPVKVRKILIGGTKKMIVYDDMESSEKVKVYNKSIEKKSIDDIHQLLVKYRSGDMLAPNISQTEALKENIINFINQIRLKNSTSENDLTHGNEIIQILENASLSLKNNERQYF